MKVLKFWCLPKQN